LIPHSSLTSGRIGEPSHSPAEPWTNSASSPPAGEQIAQFGGKKAVQIQQPIAGQNGGSACAFVLLALAFARLDLPGGGAGTV
jgi:hypothetical protein